MRKLLKKSNIILFFKFSCVGVLNTLIDNGLFFVLCDCLLVDKIISNVVSYIVSATNSYLLNAKAVYKEEKYTFSKYFKFLLGNTSVLVISTLSLLIFSKFFKYQIIAKLLTVPITMILNFIFQRFILFKKSADKIS